MLSVHYRWCCMKQWQCNRMCYYLGIISLDLALPVLWVKMAKRAWRDSTGFSSHWQLMKEVGVWTDHAQLSEAARSEMSLLDQGYRLSPVQVRFEAGSSNTKHPQEDSWNPGLEITSKADLTRPRCEGKPLLEFTSFLWLFVVNICLHVTMIIYICS